VAKQRGRDLTKEQAKTLGKLVKGELYPLVEHGGRGLGWLLGVDQSHASRLLSDEPSASLAIAVRVARILGRPLLEVIGEPAKLPDHEDPRVQAAMRAAALQGVPSGKIQAVIASRPAFEGGSPGADDWFRRFSEGYVEAGGATDTARARATIKKKKKR
jgi:hypothetical protein